MSGCSHAIENNSSIYYGVYPERRIVQVSTSLVNDQPDDFLRYNVYSSFICLENFYFLGYLNKSYYDIEHLRFPLPNMTGKNVMLMYVSIYSYSGDKTLPHFQPNSKNRSRSQKFTPSPV